jgi:hypothetical protein
VVLAQATPRHCDGLPAATTQRKRPTTPARAFARTPGANALLLCVRLASGSPAAAAALGPLVPRLLAAGCPVAARDADGDSALSLMLARGAPAQAGEWLEVAAKHWDAEVRGATGPPGPPRVRAWHQDREGGDRAARRLRYAF